MKNYAVEKIECHAGNLRKKQQVGDNHIYHCRNPHIRFHVANYMLENSIPSRYDLQYVIDNAKEQMKRY